MGENFSSIAAFIWSLADLLRGDFKQSQYGRIILPFTVLRRLECVLTPNRDKVIEVYNKNKPGERPEILLRRTAKKPFFNTSRLTLSSLRYGGIDVTLNQ